MSTIRRNRLEVEALERLITEQERKIIGTSKISVFTVEELLGGKRRDSHDIQGAAGE